MKTKKYWIWVIVSFSILVVVWSTPRITGETDQSAKEKKTGSVFDDFKIKGNNLIINMPSKSVVMIELTSE